MTDEKLVNDFKEFIREWGENIHAVHTNPNDLEPQYKYLKFVLEHFPDQTREYLKTNDVAQLIRDARTYQTPMRIAKGIEELFWQHPAGQMLHELMKEAWGIKQSEKPPEEDE